MRTSGVLPLCLSAVGCANPIYTATDAHQRQRPDLREIAYNSYENAGAFLYSDGAMMNLNDVVAGWTPGAQLTDANGISDRGQIIAYSGMNGHSYLLDPEPVPEQASWSSACAVLAAILYCRSRSVSSAGIGSFSFR